MFEASLVLAFAHLFMGGPFLVFRRVLSAQVSCPFAWSGAVGRGMPPHAVFIVFWFVPDSFPVVRFGATGDRKPGSWGEPRKSLGEPRKPRRSGENRGEPGRTGENRGEPGRTGEGHTGTRA